MNLLSILHYIKDGYVLNIDNLAKKWSTEHVKLWGHPTRTFETHKNSKGHKESLQKQINVKRMLAKGNIY